MFAQITPRFVPSQSIQMRGLIMSTPWKERKMMRYDKTEIRKDEIDARDALEGGEVPPV